MGEGPVKVRNRRSRVRQYTAIAAAAVMGTGLAVGATVTSASASPTTASSIASPATGSASSWYLPGRHRHADQAPRRDLPGERLLRSLLRHLPARGQHRRRAAFHASPGTPG